MAAGGDVTMRRRVRMRSTWMTRSVYIYTYKRLLPVLMLSELERPKPAILSRCSCPPLAEDSACSQLSPVTARRYRPRSNWRDATEDTVAVCSRGSALRRWMQLRTSPAEMTAYGAELFSSYNDVVARREWEIGMIKEKLEKGEVVDLPLCRIERVSA